MVGWIALNFACGLIVATCFSALAAFSFAFPRGILVELLLLLLPAPFPGSPPRRLVDAASFDLLALPEGTVDGELILLRGPGV